LKVLQQMQLSRRPQLRPAQQQLQAVSCTHPARLQGVSGPLRQGG
jgi:hypothetical protein